MTEFTHLHVHSHYTLLESPSSVSALIGRCEELDMKAMALTDRGNLFAALEFQEKAGDLKSIIGCQVNTAPLGMHERTRDMHQLVLIAQNRQGYLNLTKMVSIAWIDGFYYEPRLDIELLKQYSDGLICLSGAGNYGYLNYHLESGNREEADRLATQLAEIFPGRFYVELTRLLPDQPDEGNKEQYALAQRLGLPVVATNWVHYLRADDADNHDVQLAVKKVTTLKDPRRKTMDSKEYYFKSANQMAELFKDIPEAISNTQVIADSIDNDIIETGVYHLPVFTPPEKVDCEAYLQTLDEDEYKQRYIHFMGKDKNLSEDALANLIESDAYLTKLCEKGFIDRYGVDPSDEYRERLDFELCTIARMGFAAYFLIVSDFINWGKDNDIPVGPGRGSAAGSIVAYALGITDICPMRYNLLFERFLNPSRISMPDIDIDFCKDRRGEVIEYVSDKYGNEAVTQIMTLGTMKARMAIKDVARAYEWSPEESQQLANAIPEDPSGKHSIPVCLGKKPLKKGKNPEDDEYDASEALVQRYEHDERAKAVLDTASSLENLGRSLGVHACGVIIAPGPVSNYIPVCQVKKKAATQYNMVQCEDCGLLKMDFLGLKTMSILKKAADIVKLRDGEDIIYNQLPIDDLLTYRLLGEGKTLGVFQCESTGFQELIKHLQPDRFEDLIALVALYRPGPLQNGMHTSYCDRKHGIEQVTYPHPVLQEILQETYGLYIYQEQIMNISRELAGFSPGEADNLRKAMGKKKIDVLQKMREKFISGAWERHQFPEDKCKEMWETFIAFASYCFNKSHSACYGLIAYWTAYMKANHMPAFMTANLIYEMGNKDKMTLFVQELRQEGLDVLPPDINESGWEFTWTGKAVRFGFGGIKGVGQAATESLIAEREANGPFTSLYNLTERVDTRSVNKRVLESMIKVGAFDSLDANRHSLCESLEYALKRGQREAKIREQQQETLFASFEENETFREQHNTYAKVDDWTSAEKLRFEKQLTGHWMSGNPIEEHRATLDSFTTHRSENLRHASGQVIIGGVIGVKRLIKTRSGSNMAIFSIEDEEGTFECVLFSGRNDKRGRYQPGAFDRFAHECEEDMVGLFIGKVDTRQRKAQPSGNENNEEGDGDNENDTPSLPSIIIEDIVPVHMIHERLTTRIDINIDASYDHDERIEQTKLLLHEHPGECPIHGLVETPTQVLLDVQFGESWTVYPNSQCLDGLRQIWGEKRIRCQLQSQLNELQNSRNPY